MLLMRASHRLPAGAAPSPLVGPDMNVNGAGASCACGRVALALTRRCRRPERHHARPGRCGCRCVASLRLPLPSQRRPRSHRVLLPWHQRPAVSRRPSQDWCVGPAPRCVPLIAQPRQASPSPPTACCAPKWSPATRATSTRCWTRAWSRAPPCARRPVCERLLCADGCCSRAAAQCGWVFRRAWCSPRCGRRTLCAATAPCSTTSARRRPPSTSSTTAWSRRRSCPSATPTTRCALLLSQAAHTHVQPPVLDPAARDA